MPVAKIDVHAHYVPADYRQALVDHGHAHPDGFRRSRPGARRPTWR